MFNSHLGNSTTASIKVDSYNNKWLLHSDGVTVYNGSGIPGRLFNPPNSVLGNVFFDADQDGIFDAADDHGLSGRKVTLLPENTSTFTGAGGFYKLYPSLGTHQIAVVVDTPFVTTSPSPLDLLMGNADQEGFDFGIWQDIPLDSVKIELTTSTSRCSGITSVWIHLRDYEEYGGKVTLYHDPLVSYIAAEPTPTATGTNLLEWDFSSLDPNLYEHIKIEFQNPGVEAVGDWLDFTATASVLVYNYAVSDVAASELRCSYDPNDKKAAPTGDFVAEYSLLTDPLDYTIRFQNMGNDTAFTIVIRDTLDANLDPNSFELLASSHNVRVVLEAGGILSFYFDNINLLWESLNEPASHGFVKYRIRPKIGLPDPTAIYNTAHIYFDYNPAIVTNTTENILVETLPFLNDEEPSVPATVLQIYPNPSTGDFWLEMSGAGEWSATIQDAFGRKLRHVASQGDKLAVASLPTGFYWVTAIQEGRKFCGKLVVLAH